MRVAYTIAGDWSHAGFNRSNCVMPQTILSDSVRVKAISTPIKARRKGRA